MIVAQNPGSSNNGLRSGEDVTPFSLPTQTRYNRFFFELFKHCKGLYYFTNLVKCSTLENEMPSQLMISNCFSKHHCQELQWFKSDIIIRMGKIHWQVEDEEKMSIYSSKNIIIPHVGYLNRNSAKYRETLDRLVNFINSGDITC